MLNLIFRSPWQVPALLALLCFLAGGWLYNDAVRHEAEAAIALQQGAPAPVSLNAFDKAKDVHPADEVHVIGWINTDYNYELTETSRKRADVVRRMFVLFGPEDAADSKQVRAVVLMPDGDVERFVAGITENLTQPFDQRLVFSLNGTSERSPTLANMANDALAEKGLTKAPGFQFIEIWPSDGRAAALAPDPTFPMIVAGFPGVPGLILLLIAFFKFSRRNRVVKPNPATVAEAMAHAAMMKKMQEQQAQSFASFATAPGAQGTNPATQPQAMLPQGAELAATFAATPLPVAKKRSFMPAPHSFGFLALAILIGMASTWTGHWQLTILAVGMGLGHFAARVKRAMDKGVTAVASAINQVKGMSRLDHSATVASGPVSGPTSRTSAVTRVPSPVERIMALGQTTSGRKVAQVAVVVVALFAAPYFLNDPLLTKLLSSSSGTSMPSMPSMPSVDQAPVVTEATAAAPAEAAAPEKAAALTVETAEPVAVIEPAADPVAPAAPAPQVDAVSPLIPAAASLRPADGQTGAPAAAPPVEVALVPAAEIAADPAVVPPVAPEAPVAATVPVVTTDAPAATVAEVPVVETAATPVAVAEPAKADEAGVAGPAFAGFDVSRLGSLLVLGPIVGAVLLAIAAFALMRGRQAAPPRVFAGKDPWERLARDVRGNA